MTPLKHRRRWIAWLAVCIVAFVGILSAMSSDGDNVDEISPLFAVRTANATDDSIPEVVARYVEGTSIVSDIATCNEAGTCDATAAGIYTLDIITCFVICPPLPTVPLITCAEVTCVGAPTCISTCDTTCASTCQVTCSLTCPETCSGYTCDTCFQTCEATCASCEPPCPESAGFGW